MATKKIIAQLDLKNIIALYTADQVRTMVTDGTLVALLQQSADIMNGGNLELAARTLLHNVQSLDCRAIGTGYAPLMAKKKEIAETLSGLVKTIIHADTDGTKPKANTDYTVEDINAITDYEKAVKVYNSMASVKRDVCTYGTNKTKTPEEAIALFNAASAKKKALGAAAKPKVTVDDAKVEALKKAGFSAKKIQQMLEIMNK